MYVCMSVTLRNAIINAYANACVYSIDILYLLPRGFYLELMMSKRKRKLARLCKQRQRSCMNPDVQWQEARRLHQHASRAAENEQIRRLILSTTFYARACYYLIEGISKTIYNPTWGWNNKIYPTLLDISGNECLDWFAHMWKPSATLTGHNYNKLAPLISFLLLIC